LLKSIFYDDNIFPFSYTGVILLPKKERYIDPNHVLSFIFNTNNNFPYFIRPILLQLVH